MNINYLDNFINRFPNVLLSHTLKLTEITDSKAIKLDDNQMLDSKEAFPNKFELEVVTVNARTSKPQPRAIISAI